MSLLEKFNNDMIKAMKEKDKERLTTLRMVKGAIQLEKKNQRDEITEDMLIDAVNKQIKLRKDSVSEFEKAGRNDLAEPTKKEIKILQDYLPEQLSEEEVNKIIDDVFNKVNPTSAKEMGIIMKEITPLVKGKADMKDISTKIRERLANL